MIRTAKNDFAKLTKSWCLVGVLSLIGLLLLGANFMFICEGQYDYVGIIETAIKNSDPFHAPNPHSPVVTVLIILYNQVFGNALTRRNVTYSS